MMLPQLRTPEKCNGLILTFAVLLARLRRSKAFPDDVPALLTCRLAMQDVEGRDQQEGRRDPDGNYPEHIFSL